MDKVAAALFSVDFLTTAVRLSVPLIFAAMGGLFSERSGVLNLALEGMMTMGAFFGFLVALDTHNLLYGVLAALAAGAFLALLHAILSVSLRADQIISAIALNLLAAGAAGYVFRLLFSSGGQSPRIAGEPAAAVPLLAGIPVIGPAFFNQPPLVYVAYLLLPACAWVINKTSWGLSLQAVGDYPRAADTLGVSVRRVRYLAVLVSGALAGLGGAFLTLVAVGYYQDGITAGRGFIAFGAIVFGKWSPLGTFLACLLFGASDAFQLRLQGAGAAVPYQFMLMVPYVVALLALLGVVGRSTAPAASGIPYAAEDR